MVIRDMFAGVNSPKGFFSYFSYIADDALSKRKIYIKGGSGMGKSTLMKKIAKKAQEQGLDIEIFHCSSDADSLDGLNIPYLGVSIIDATAPHIGDPLYPGCGGEILNLTEFIECEKCIPKKGEIVKYGNLKKDEFKKGYKYLAAAAELVERSALSKANAFREGMEIAKRFLKTENSGLQGRERKMFLSALCPGGNVSYHETSFAPEHKISISGEIAHEVLNIVRDFAKNTGFDVECFYCPMFPDTLCDHVYIPGLKTVFSAQNAFHAYTGDEIIDLTAYNTFKSDFELVSVLTNRAIKCFEKAREIHLEIEKINIPAMDFDSLGKKCDDIIKSIFA